MVFDNTLADFWRMIWHEQITHIVMLTNITEKGKAKCQLYWPEDEEDVKTYGPVTVSTSKLECRDSFHIRTFTVKKIGSNESREVTQYHYISWPDHGVPMTTSLVIFWRYVTKMIRQAGKSGSAVPILIHCSAGVGRTGTYIGLDIGMDLAVKAGRVDIYDLVGRLRDERYLMVQAMDQYLFLHKALLEAYTARDTNMPIDRFDVIYPQPIRSGISHSRIDKEFQTLQQMLSLTPEHRYDAAKDKANADKNRNADILPPDEHLIFLTEHVQGRNQYINAVFMPTFRDSMGHIVTQLPLPSTLVDFWRLVYGNDVTTIVSLSSPNESKEIKSFCQYWPLEEADAVKTGPYHITLLEKSPDLGSDITSYKLSLGKKGVTYLRSVQLLHYHGWTGEVGGTPADLLHLIDTLVASHMTAHTNRLVVQCSDGVGKSGLFCALYDVINRMTYDREVDVYMTVRHLQSIRPKAVKSVVQYRYCYEVVQSRVHAMNVYANT